MITKATAMAVLLLGVFTSAALGFSSDGSSLARTTDRSTVWTGSAVVFTANFTNAGGAPLRGFYYAEQVPSGLVVKTLGVAINGQRVADYSFVSGKDGEIYAGCTPRRWFLERPPAFSANNSIPPGGTVQIVYSVAASAAGSFTLPQFSWVAYDPASGNASFGSSEVSGSLQYIAWTNWMADAKGNYSGLFYDDPASPDSSGAVSISIGSKASYSGRLRAGTRSASFTGHFDPLGSATNVVKTHGQNPVVLELHLDSGEQDVVISGQVTSESSTATLSAHRQLYHAKTNPAPCAGLYTVVLPVDAAEPEGYSYGSVKVSASGLVSFTASLADGTKVTQASAVVGTDLWPVYAPLHGGSGMLLGWLAFHSQNGSDIAGQLAWIKPPVGNARYYSEGFTNQCTARASLFHPPASPDLTLLTPAQVNAAFSGGNLSSDFTLPLELQASGAVKNLSDLRLNMKCSLSTGLFRGRVVDPATGDAYNFGGAVLLNQNMGFGLLLGSDKTSRVIIGP